MPKVEAKQLLVNDCFVVRNSVYTVVTQVMGGMMEVQRIATIDDLGIVRYNVGPVTSFIAYTKVEVFCVKGLQSSSTEQIA